MRSYLGHEVLGAQIFQVLNGDLSISVAVQYFEITFDIGT